MIAVNLWKPQKLQAPNRFTVSLARWRFVRIAENSGHVSWPVVNFRVSSTAINKFSAPFSSLLHRCMQIIADRITKVSKPQAHDNEMQ